MAVGSSDGVSYEDAHDYYLGMPHSKEQAPDMRSTGDEDMFNRGVKHLYQDMKNQGTPSRRPEADPEKPTGEFKIDRDHNVPLIASALTKDGSTPYGMAIDHRVSTDMEFEGKTHDITPFLQAHENAELGPMADAVKGGMDAKSAYELAHDKVANPAEAAVRNSYAISNGLDVDKFNEAYWSHINTQKDVAAQPSDKQKHPDAHTTRYSLDPDAKVVMDLEDTPGYLLRHGGQNDIGGMGWGARSVEGPMVQPKAANENVKTEDPVDLHKMFESYEKELKSGRYKEPSEEDIRAQSREIEMALKKVLGVNYLRDVSKGDYKPASDQLRDWFNPDK